MLLEFIGAELVVDYRPDYFVGRHGEIVRGVDNDCVVEVAGCGFGARIFFAIGAGVRLGNGSPL